VTTPPVRALVKYHKSFEKIRKYDTVTIYVKKPDIGKNMK